MNNAQDICALQGANPCPLQQVFESLKTKMTKLTFWKKEKTSRELQAELKALVQRLVAQRGYSFDEMDRYEELLRELYLRGEEPETILEQK